MTFKNMLVYGYLYGSINGLLGTIVFTSWKIARFISINGVDVYLENWDYPRHLIYAGAIISFFPAGVGGMVLSYFLWRLFVNDSLTYQGAVAKGCLIGVVDILVVFGFILITPLSSAIFRLNTWAQLMYLLVVISIGALVGGGTGLSLTKLVIGKSNNHLKQ